MRSKRKKKVDLKYLNDFNYSVLQKRADEQIVRSCDGNDTKKKSSDEIKSGDVNQT